MIGAIKKSVRNGDTIWSLTDNPDVILETDDVILLDSTVEQLRSMDKEESSRIMEELLFEVSQRVGEPPLGCTNIIMDNQEVVELAETIVSDRDLSAESIVAIVKEHGSIYVALDNPNIKDEIVSSNCLGDTNWNGYGSAPKTNYFASASGGYGSRYIKLEYNPEEALAKLVKQAKYAKRKTNSGQVSSYHLHALAEKMVKLYSMHLSQTYISWGPAVDIVYVAKRKELAIGAIFSISEMMQKQKLQNVYRSGILSEMEKVVPYAKGMAKSKAKDTTNRKLGEWLLKEMPLVRRAHAKSKKEDAEKKTA